MKIKKHKLTPQVRESIKDRQKLVWDSLFYTNQRMDLLIITISGAGIYACGEISKYFLEKKQPILDDIKVVAFLFVLSIIVNFISQWFASKTHYFDFLSIHVQLDDEIDPSVTKDEYDAKIQDSKDAIDLYESKSDCFNNLTIYANNISILLMIAALIYFMFFLFTTF